MQQVLSDFLAQNGYCHIPMAGTLVSTKSSAKFDGGNNELDPPHIAYTLEPDSSRKKELVNYIADLYRTDTNAAEQKLSAFNNWLRKEFDSNRPLVLNQLNVSRKNGSFSISPNEQYNLLYPVKANRVIRQNAAHEVLVGDRTTTNEEMLEFLSTTSKNKSFTWILVLAAIAVVGLVLWLAWYFNLLS